MWIFSKLAFQVGQILIFYAYVWKYGRELVFQRYRLFVFEIESQWGIRLNWTTTKYVGFMVCGSLVVKPI